MKRDTDEPPLWKREFSAEHRTQLTPRAARRKARLFPIPTPAIQKIDAPDRDIEESPANTKAHMVAPAPALSG